MQINLYRRDHLTPITIDVSKEAGQKYAQKLKDAGYFEDKARS